MNSNDDDDDDDNDDDDIIRGKPFNETAYGLDALTRTDFLRELLEEARNAATDDDLNNNHNNDYNHEADAEAVVKRRKKNKKSGRGSMEYRTLDNHDKLPFEVRSTSPDPYTTGNQAKLRQKLLQQQQEQEEADGGDDDTSNSNNNNNKRKNMKHGKKTKSGGKSNSGTAKSRKTDLAKNLGIAADIYKEDEEGMFAKVLGKFQLDKSTNCGDVLEIGDQSFRVLRARCQYKYAGGKQFVITKKILEVKEINRIEQEESVMRQFEKKGNVANVPSSEQ